MLMSPLILPKRYMQTDFSILICNDILEDSNIRASDLVFYKT